MLKRLTSEDITKYWDVLKYGLEQSLAPYVSKSETVYTDLLRNGLEGHVHYWAEMNGSDKLQGFVTTMVTQDNLDGSSTLLILSIWGVDDVTHSQYREGLSALKKFAKQIGCTQIGLYTELESIVNIVQTLGGTHFHYLTVELED